VIIKITELNVFILEKVIQEFAPEVTDIYNIREDESEEQQIKTGQLHENRILGIMLKFYLEGKPKVTTRDVELEYKKYFKEIARSTISTYLNMLKKESTLYKERDGRLVYYILNEDPPKNINPFWFTRIFCIDPAYFFRAIYFASIYSIAEIIVQEHMDNENSKEYIKFFQYIVGLIILYILKNRADKCFLCQFSKHQRYNEMIGTLNTAIRDRSDVLPDDLTNSLVEDYAEIPTFSGLNIKSEESELVVIKKLVKLAKEYRKDIEFQNMVLKRRTDAKLLQRVHLENNELESEEEKVVN